MVITQKRSDNLKLFSFNVLMYKMMCLCYLEFMWIAPVKHIFHFKRSTIMLSTNCMRFNIIHHRLSVFMFEFSYPICGSSNILHYSESTLFFPLIIKCFPNNAFSFYLLLNVSFFLFQFLLVSGVVI